MFLRKKEELESKLRELDENQAQELMAIEIKVNEYKNKLIADCLNCTEAEKNEINIKLDFLEELERERAAAEISCIDPNDINGNL